MPAPRLLILADPKMIPALAAGLREGGRFDVTALSLADVVAAQAAAERVEALAVFYGAPGAPLSAALQALAPKLRERGARVVAVLQREQATQRDDCFRAGASDLLFMPMPKDQFVGRLAASVGLAFAQDGGAPAPVAVAARSAVSRIERATVSAIGVESPAALSLKPGETVRLSWGAFQSWGLVVRGGPSAQIRFAGLAPDEEAKIQQWVKSGAQLAGAAAADGPLIPAAPPAAPLIPAPPPASAAAPRIPTAPIRPPGMTTGPITDRIAPTAGPPPGFVDRKPVRPQSRPAARPPITTPVAGSAPVAKAGAEPPRGAPAAPAPARPSPAQNGGGGLEALFEGEAAAPAAPAPQKKPVPQGPPWPGIIDAAACKEAALQLLTDDTVGHGVSAHVAASARKVTGMLSPGERASIDRTGPDGHFAQTLAARIALDAAAAEANRLASGSISPTVDIDALTAVTKVADEAAARLTKEANAAIGKGEVEHLQLITAASAALSRDLLNVKELADRFRGVTAAPRLGAGALDPDVVLPGQNPRPRAPVSQAPAPVKAELRDFRGLDHKPSGRGKGVLAFLLFAGAVAAVANGFYFGVPRQHRVAFEDAGVRSINVSGASAVVTVTPDWLAAKDANLPKLLQALRARQVKKAVLMLPSGAAVGIIDTGSAKMSGAPSASK